MPTKQLPPPEYIFAGLGDSVTCCATVVDPHCNRMLLMVGTVDGTCRLFDALTKKVVVTIAPDGGAVVSCGQLLDQRLWVHIRNCQIRIYNLDNLQRVTIDVTLPLGHYGFCGASMTSSRQKLAIPNETTDGQMSVSIYMSTVTTTIGIAGADDDKRGAIMSMRWIDDEHRLLIAFENGLLILFDTNECVELSRIQAHDDTILDVCAYNDDRICTGSIRSPIRLWRLIDRTRIVINGTIDYPNASQGCSTLAYSPRGRILSAGFWDGAIRLYSTKTNRIITFVDFHSTTINRLCWSAIVPMRSRLLVCASDGRLSVWHLYDDVE